MFVLFLKGNKSYLLHPYLSEIICGNLICGFYCQGYAPYGLCVHLSETANDSCCNKYPQKFQWLTSEVPFFIDITIGFKMICGGMFHIVFQVSRPLPCCTSTIFSTWPQGTHVRGKKKLVEKAHLTFSCLGLEVTFISPHIPLTRTSSRDPPRWKEAGKCG